MVATIAAVILKQKSAIRNRENRYPPGVIVVGERCILASVSAWL